MILFLLSKQGRNSEIPFAAHGLIMLNLWQLQVQIQLLQNRRAKKVLIHATSYFVILGRLKGLAQALVASLQRSSTETNAEARENEENIAAYHRM